MEEWASPSPSSSSTPLLGHHPLLRWRRGTDLSTAVRAGLLWRFRAVVDNAVGSDAGRFDPGDRGQVSGGWIPLGFGCLGSLPTGGLHLKSLNVKDIQGNERGGLATTSGSMP